MPDAPAPSSPIGPSGGWSRARRASEGAGGRRLLKPAGGRAGRGEEGPLSQPSNSGICLGPTRPLWRRTFLSLIQTRASPSRAFSEFGGSARLFLRLPVRGGTRKPLLGPVESSGSAWESHPRGSGGPFGLDFPHPPRFLQFLIPHCCSLMFATAAVFWPLSAACHHVGLTGR